MAMGDSEKECLLEGTEVVDFDVLCSTVALQTHGKWGNLGSVRDGDEDEDEDEDEEEEEGEELGAVLRMWEGQLLDCFDDYDVALESTCCPCYRFGKNMKRAGFGSSYTQGVIYFVLAMSALLNLTTFIVTRRHCFLFLAVVFSVAIGTYLGFFRSRLRNKFNIKDNDSHTSFDDCFYHFICPCCTLCQESRTLEMNNVEDGTWHGRGDTILIGGLISEENKAVLLELELHPPPIVSISSPVMKMASTNLKMTFINQSRSMQAS